nr:hypothetical protein [Tanacetum cinerariifolium]
MFKLRNFSSDGSKKVSSARNINCGSNFSQPSFTNISYACVRKRFHVAVLVVYVAENIVDVAILRVTHQTCNVDENCSISSGFLMLQKVLLRGGKIGGLGILGKGSTGVILYGICLVLQKRTQDIATTLNLNPDNTFFGVPLLSWRFKGYPAQSSNKKLNMKTKSSHNCGWRKMTFLILQIEHEAWEASQLFKTNQEENIDELEWHDQVVEDETKVASGKL